MSHTKAPWAAFKYPDTKTWTVAAGKSVASKIATEHDARLISAAPDMLSALEYALEYMEDFGIEDQEPLDVIKRSIAKAKGEQTYQYNVYSLNWNYLGCFWAGTLLHGFLSIGDFRRTKHSGPILTKEGVEIDQIEEIEVYIKVVDQKGSK